MNFDSLKCYPNGMSPLIGLLKLFKRKSMNAPQQVTSRYARNLIIKGKNTEFHLLKIERHNHWIDGAWIANYYNAEIVSTNGMSHTAAAPSPEMAVNRALEKHGVTFR
jgi:hypothetical protein